VTAPTYAELAVAIAYVLQKWKDAGAPEAETAQFDDLLIRAAAAPPEQPVPPARKAKADDDDDAPVTPPRKGIDYSPQLAALDAAIEEENRKALDE
jgi:hypothetical protein